MGRMEGHQIKLNGIKLPPKGLYKELDTAFQERLQAWGGGRSPSFLQPPQFCHQNVAES